MIKFLRREAPDLQVQIQLQLSMYGMFFPQMVQVLTNE